MNLFLHWFAMNGYANYIWPAYGLVGGVLILNLFHIKWQNIRSRKLLQHWFNRT